MQNSILANLTSRMNELNDFAQEVLVDLVKIPTVNPPGQNYSQALSFVRDIMEEFGLKTEIVQTPDWYVKETEGLEHGLSGERLNLIAKNYSSEPEIVMNAHIDTVPEGSGWTIEPFKGETKDGLVYGRGAADDKSGVAALIVLAKIINDLNLPVPPVEMTVTVDEEIGGEAGLGYLVKKGMVKGKFFLSADGPLEYILAYHNGIYRFNVLTRGKAAHASMPFRGVNAIEKASKVIQALRDYRVELLSRKSSYAASPDLAERGFNTLFPSLNIGVIRGGTKVNVVPDFCEMEVERRFTPDENVDNVKSEVFSILDRLKLEDEEMNFVIKDVFVKDAVRTDVNNKFLKLVKKSAYSVLGKELPVAGTTGATDMSFTSNILKIPSVAFGPIRSDERIHGPDEFVRVSDVVDVAFVYTLLLASFKTQPS
jgi:succinyl-diaminopimelate desuccinylase